MNKMLIAAFIVMTMISCKEKSNACPPCPECPEKDVSMEMMLRLVTDREPPYSLSGSTWSMTDKRNGVKYEITLTPVKQ